MRNAYSFLFALVVGAASLTSCSKSTYSFNNSVPAYLESQPVQMTAKATPAPLASVAVEANVPAPAAHATPATLVSATEAIPARYAPPASADAVAPLASAAKSVKPSLVQRMVLKKLVKILPKQATAGTAHTAASKVGRAGLVILAGAVIILIGGLIGGANIVVTIGGIVFVLGLILLVIALVSN